MSRVDRALLYAATAALAALLAFQVVDRAVDWYLWRAGVTQVINRATAPPTPTAPAPTPAPEGGKRK